MCSELDFSPRPQWHQAGHVVNKRVDQDTPGCHYSNDTQRNMGSRTKLARDSGLATAYNRVVNVQTQETQTAKARIPKVGHSGPATPQADGGGVAQ